MIGELKYLLVNHIICNIPIWVIRKWLYRLCGMQIGKGSRILLKTRVYCPKRIIIGDYTIVNEYCYLDGRGGLRIGSNTTIAVYTKIISAGHNIDSNSFEYTDAPIEIGDNVAIFADSIVLGGAHINKGAVFYGRSVIPKGEYVENGVYAGNPAKYIRRRKSESDYTQNEWAPVFR